MSKIISVIVAGLVFFSACQKSLDLGNQNFMGTTRIGDNFHVDIKKDKIHLLLEGKMSGTQIDGTLLPVSPEKSIFTLKERPDLQILLSLDDLIILGTKDGGSSRFGVGLSSYRKPYTIGDIAGKYNFVVQYIPGNQNKFRFGTFEIGTDRSWRTWIFGDGIANKLEPDFSGHWVDDGTGKIQAFLSDEKLYATLALSQQGGELLVINLLLKNGLALGVKRKAIAPGSIDGQYDVLSSKGNGIKRAIVKNNFALKGAKKLELIYNDPWEGFFRDSKGEMLAVYSSKVCFGLNFGAISGSQYIFAAVKNN